MKRIIFSIYKEDIDDHTSAPTHKRNQFKKFKNQIVENHKKYAKLCKADYRLYDDVNTNYDIIQFQKIKLLKDLCKFYDEVLYLDFDVIINTNKSFFEHFDLNTICAYGLERKYIRQAIHNSMDMYSKACCKNAMLLLNDIVGSDYIINTGVIGINKLSCNYIDFSSCSSLYQMAKQDNVYPVEMSSKWKPNNEVYLSYLIEKNDLPYTNIGLQWNFILDDKHNKVSSAAHFYHCVNKDFNLLLS